MTSIRAIAAPFIASLVAGYTMSCSTVEQAPAVSCPSDQALASLIAGSDYVVIASMQLGARLAGASQLTPQYVELPIEVISNIKGELPEASSVRYFNQERPYQPSIAALTGLENEQAILFLTRVDDSPSAAGLYFAGYSSSALLPASQTSVAATRAETMRQRHLLQSWRPNSRLPAYSKVRELIAKLGNVSGNDQQHVFDRLEALGLDAVPAIVAQMDDRRRLRTRAISLANRSADAFEGTRHYGPELVVDGLAAILNQITGAGFGAIYNGGSARERDAAVTGWRIYAADLQCPPSDG
jgi:hypothetical protein